jgi:hypothetical protein
LYFGLAFVLVDCVGVEENVVVVVGGLAKSNN